MTGSAPDAGILAVADGGASPHRGAYLITGAAGFIGSHLVDALLARGDRVIGLDNFDDFYDPAVKRENLSGALESDRFQLVEGDIRDLQTLNEVFGGEEIGTVIHLAARGGVRPSIESPLLYQSVNMDGTASLLEVMRMNSCQRLIFASSSSVYGDNPSLPFRESDRVDHPMSPYAATKKGGELLCHAYHHLHGMAVACLRFFTVYGPRQRPEMAIHTFTRLIAEGKEVPMFGDGSSARDYTYVDDIVQGVLAVERNLAGYAILNLGESITTTLRELIEMIAAELGVDPRIRELPMQRGDVARTCADISAARRLGYVPRVPIREGIRRFMAWYRERTSGVEQAGRRTEIDLSKTE